MLRFGLDMLIIQRISLVRYNQHALMFDPPPTPMQSVHMENSFLTSMYKKLIIGIIVPKKYPYCHTGHNSAAATAKPSYQTAFIFFACGRFAVVKPIDGRQYATDTTGDYSTAAQANTDEPGGIWIPRF